MYLIVICIVILFSDWFFNNSKHHVGIMLYMFCQYVFVAFLSA